MSDEFVDSIADLATQRVEAVTPSDEDVNIVLQKNDERLHFVSLENYLPAPRRPRGTTTAWDLVGFFTLLDAYDATIFADDTRKRFTAVFNADGWRDHTAVFELRTTPEWDLWAGHAGKFLKQTQFAELLEDGAIAVVEPSAADLMMIAQTFQAKRNVHFESGTRLQSGDVKFVWHEETKAKAGVKGEVDIPEVFKLRLPVYQGGGLVEMEARLRYRIDEDALLLGYRIARLEDYKREGFNTLLDEVKAGLVGGQQLVYGPAPAPITPL